MAEYIDREALLLRLKKVVPTGDDFGLGMKMATSHAIECIEEAPAADVAEVKQGVWEGSSGDACSVCGEEWFDWISMRAFATNYCPSCGAKMDGIEI